MKKILLFILVFSLFIVNVKAYKIVSLGDSIPNGYLLDDEEDSFDNRLANTLKADFYEFSYIGMRSDDLLRELDRKEIKDNIKDADIVIINIGANDLLDLLDLLDLNKLNIDFEYGENIQVNLNKDYLDGIYNYIKSFFEDELEPKAKEALLEFKEVFPKIISKIKEYNPNVKIYVNSLYNPFFDISIPLLSYDLDFISNISDEAIKSFNDVINLSDEYTVVDTYNILRDNKYLNINIMQGLLDPHPNAFGHKKLYEAYLKELCYKVTYEDEDYYVLKGSKFDIKPKEKKGYTFKKWNYDINKIDKDVVLKEVYKKDVNYYLIGSIAVIGLLIGVLIIKKLRKD